MTLHPGLDMRSVSGEILECGARRMLCHIICRYNIIFKKDLSVADFILVGKKKYKKQIPLRSDRSQYHNLLSNSLSPSRD